MWKEPSNNCSAKSMSMPAPLGTLFLWVGCFPSSVRQALSTRHSNLTSFFGTKGKKNKYTDSDKHKCPLRDKQTVNCIFLQNHISETRFLTAVNNSSEIIMLFCIYTSCQIHFYITKNVLRYTYIHNKHIYLLQSIIYSKPLLHSFSILF